MVLEDTSSLSNACLVHGWPVTLGAFSDFFVTGPCDALGEMVKSTIAVKVKNKGSGKTMNETK